MFSKRTKSSSDSVNDAEFGTLSFTDYGDTASYSCRIVLPISSKKVDVFFDTSSNEHIPTDQQKQFLKNVIDNYDSLIRKIIPIISTTADHSNLKVKAIDKSKLQPVSLIVPQVDTGAFKWDITFEASSLKDTFIIVHFDKFTPLSATTEKSKQKSLTKFLLRLLNGTF